MDESKSIFSNLFGARDYNTCEVCGNYYDKCFQVRKNGETHVFDSFECAIHALAPRCDHCGCAIVGHGMETNGHFYCCAHCASASGETRLQDRAEHGHTERKSA